MWGKERGKERIERKARDIVLASFLEIVTRKENVEKNFFFVTDKISLENREILQNLLVSLDFGATCFKLV